MAIRANCNRNVIQTNQVFQVDNSFSMHAHCVLTCVAGLAGALVAIDFVDARAKVTGVALAVVNVDFTVGSLGKAFQSDIHTKTK